MRRRMCVKIGPGRVLCHKTVHHHIMAETAAHDKEMKNLMGAEIFMAVVEERQLHRLDNAAQGIDNAAGQEPQKSCRGKRADDLGDS